MEWFVWFWPQRVFIVLKPTEVGIFPPNAFGLYDMHGNVDEWCADAWHNNYEGAPSDGSVWEIGNESSPRVIRGGAWDDVPRYVRVSDRVRNSRDRRDNDVGFRGRQAVTLCSFYFYSFSFLVFFTARSAVAIFLLKH